MKKNWKYTKFAVPSLIVLVLTLIIYAIKGIYPFGSLTIAHADMGQSYGTFYHILWDALRNGKSILYSYVLGSGSNVFGGVLLDGFASPLAWMIALFKRENIRYAFSYMLLIKMVLIAFTAYVFFNKIYQKEDNKFEFWKIAFSVMYAMGSYVLINYTNIMWLDIVILFPLFCLSIYRLFNENKSGMFILILTLCLIISYYISYMLLFFILSCIPLGIIFYVKKEDRKRISGKVIVAVLTSLMLSMFSFLPAFGQTMSSYRMAGTTVNEITNVNFMAKMISFLFSSISLVGCAKLLKHFKDDKNAKLLLLSVLVSGILPVLFERINLLWHTGSYNAFPFRYGFIPTFILLNCGIYYFYKYYEEVKENFDKKNIILIVIAFIIVGITSCGLIPGINHNDPAYGIQLVPFVLFVIQAIVLSTTVFIILKIKNDKVKYTLLSIVIISEILVRGVAYIGVPEKYRKGTEHSDDTLVTANEIIKNFDIKDDELYRYRDVEMIMTENYPVITNTPSMATFLHVITGEQVLTHSQLGYTRQYTKLGDAGGTILSDALLNVKYLFSKKPLEDSTLYNYLGSAGDIKLYEYKNTLPFGAIYKNNEDISEIPEKYQIYDAQNYVCKQLFNTDEDIIKPANIVNKEENELGTISGNYEYMKYKYEVDINKKSKLYFYEKGTIILRIMVNGEELNIPNMNAYNSRYYPARFNNGILDLGVYENEKVEIELYSLKLEEDIKLGTIVIDDYNKIFENRKTAEIHIKDNKINVTYDATQEGEKIFLPVTYDKGWTGTNNGENININRVFNTYISLDLKKGENNIELTFIPNNMILGIKISLITLAIVLIYTFLIKRFIKKDSILDKIIVNIGFVAYIIITLAFYIKVYAINIIKTIVALFSNK